MKNKDKHIDAANQGASSVNSAKSIEDLQWVKYANEKTGHGFSAEDANALNDKLRGRKVAKVGLTNEKDGADRIVNGKMIQTKYYKTAADTVESAFSKQTGLFRYKQQLLEVPKEQYEEAIKLMADKIKEGKVPGVNNPNDAEKIIKKGDVSYRQAKNIAKAGNVDSLYFDLKAQSVVALHGFGISFVMQYANCIWNGMDMKDALRLSVTSGLRTGGVVIGAGVMTQQLLRTSLGRSFAAYTSTVSKQVIDHLYKTEFGKKAIHKMATVMLGKNLAGAAAKNAVTKMLRTNIVTASVTTAVMALPDFYKALVSQKISWKQFAKNLTVNAAGVAGGAAGAYGGATIGGIIGGAIGTMIAPGAGTAIGAKIGVFIGGAAGGLGVGMGASMGSKKVLDFIAEDDAQEMFKLAQEAVVELATDYMVSETEFDKASEKIVQVVTPKWLETMYQSGNAYDDKKRARYQFAYHELESVFEEMVKERSKLSLPTEKEIKKQVRMMYFYLFYQFIKTKMARMFGIKSDLSTTSS